MTKADLAQQLRSDFATVFDCKQGRRIVRHLQNVFGDIPTKPLPISGDQMRGRQEVITYILNNAELISERPDLSETPQIEIES